MKLIVRNVILSLSNSLEYGKLLKDFFKGHERTVKAKKNIIASLVLRGISVLTSLVLVPLTIDYVNPTKYGIWLTLTSIIYWFAFFDIGLGNGLRNKLTESIAKGDKTLTRSYLSTAYALLIGIFSIVWLLFVIASSFLNWSGLLNAPQELNGELSWLALIIISYFCIQFILKNVNTLLTADQKPARAAFIDMSGQVMALVAIFILTRLTKGSLINLGLGIGVPSVLVLVLASTWYYRRRYKDINPGFNWINKDCARDMIGLSMKFFFLQIASFIVFGANNIIIAHIYDPEEVTVYNVAYKYFSVVVMVFIIIITPYWSAFTDAHVRNDTEWMKDSVKRLERIWLIVASGGLFLLFFSRFFFPLWLGDKVHVPFSVSVILLLYVLIYTRLNLYLYLLNGIGKVKMQILFYIPLCIVNIPLLVFMGEKLGLEGLIAGNILISIPHLIYGPVQLRRIIEKRAQGLWNL
ncbi:MAG TPA: oligosaccharide flippase family protein [Bacteroidales bacterium]|nr:oligosaccharide flippase family protein [Bacteroidales bacterium]